MNFFIVGLALCMFAFAAAWATGLLLSRTLTRVVDHRSARRAFALGVAPLALGLAAVVLCVGPAFLIYEPRDAHEVPGIVFMAGGGAGLALLMRAAGRFARMLMASRRLIREWARQAEPLTSVTVMPAMTVDVGHPIVAVAGLARSALYIDRQVLSACSRDEIEAIAAHELAHVRSRDNAKRLLLAATRGLGHPLAAAWRDAAEMDADRFAASDERRGVALASALVKVARVATSRRLDACAVSGVHEGGNIETRVRALLSGGRPGEPQRRTLEIALAVGLTVLVPLAWKPIHEAVELAVNYLP
jgi:Zn-dependent protease with chaperone function